MSRILVSEPQARGFSPSPSPSPLCTHAERPCALLLGHTNTDQVGEPQETLTKEIRMLVVYLFSSFHVCSRDRPAVSSQNTLQSVGAHASNGHYHRRLLNTNNSYYYQVYMLRLRGTWHKYY